MYSFIRYASLVVMVLVVSAGCETTPDPEKYILVVTDKAGIPLKDAVVTPQIASKNFEAKNTGPDGQVDLRGLYSEVPTTILIRAGGYKPRRVKWQLPDRAAQIVVLEKR